MNITKIDEAAFDLVEVKTTNECKPTPHCKNHGAMNKITITENGGGIWRCITVSGYRRVKSGNARGEEHAETICRAGCFQTNK